jgi:hypothetical protein
MLLKIKLKLIEATLPEAGVYALPKTELEHVVPFVPSTVPVTVIPCSAHEVEHEPVTVKPFPNVHE